VRSVLAAWISRDPSDKIRSLFQITHSSHVKDELHSYSTT
jgi:hypothetical protein